MSEVQYITDFNGQRTGVILPIGAYEELVSGRLDDYESPEEEEDLDRRFGPILEVSPGDGMETK
jgi:hypothetical protein